MMKTKTIVWSLTLLALSVLFLLSPASGFSEEPQKLVVLPFTMNSDRDLNFLREGIMDMLSSRLAWKDKLEIIEKGVVKKEFDAVPGPMNEAKALAIGKVLGADYVIFGSLTVFGESVSLDAKNPGCAKIGSSDHRLRSVKGDGRGHSHGQPVCGKHQREDYGKGCSLQGTEAR